MGFCLFRHASQTGSFFAVNPASVDLVEEVSNPKTNQVHCLFHIDHKALEGDKAFRPVVAGRVADINAVLKQGAHLGVKPLKTVMIAKMKSKRAMPLLLAQPDRIMLIYDIDPEHYTEDTPFAAGSIALFDDGSTRILGLRPGVLAHQINARHTVPMLI
ncbi:MAG: hypothetical protein L6Q57_07185 [Alphaproteobacteria bacterium]|nr:hypothetical protein [Alphaproteobacteria bacterium]